MADQPLRPRFKVQKKRIGDGQSGNPSGGAEFTPEKIIYVELDDEITAVFDRVKRTRQKRIALVVPRRAVIIQSVINLKILKKKFDELEKEIVMVTTDTAGLKLAEKAGIPSIDRLWEKEPAPLVPTPLPLLRGERPVRLPADKLSISQVIGQGKTDALRSFLARIKEKVKKKKSAAGKTRIVFIAPNKQALFTLILVSMLLLLTIAYIALPGATITITPKSSILDPSHNVTFLDAGKNRDILENPPGNSILIATYPVHPPSITKTFTHPATGKLFQGENAHGVLTVINLSNGPWDLAARTRFQTENGLVFRTPIMVRVPAGSVSGSTPGTLDVAVTADGFDANGQIVGERGNIGPAKFFLPGLKNDENKKKLFAESKMPMAGGITKIAKSITKEDVEASRDLVKSEINKGAEEDLKKYLVLENGQKKTNLSLLTDRHAIKVSEPNLAVPEQLIGTSAEEFRITATYTVSGVAFDRDELIQALKERLITRVDPDKKIIKVEENDISYRFLDQDEAAGKIRLTATMRAVQSYELDPDKENGRRFIKKITDHVVGLRIKEALTYLQQQTDEISRVDISLWPVWAPTIPNIADNIKFVIKEWSP